MDTVTTERNAIQFNVAPKGEPIICLKANGEIYVRGKLIEKDEQLVEAMREFLIESGFLK